jgi:pimeloyl-ACP methyl ester carboxylesterase
MKTLLLIGTLLLIKTAPAQQKPNVNYDESKVPAYTLPDPLKTQNNTPITNKQQWETQRRPEILRLFEDNIYGQIPKQFDSLRFAIANRDEQAMNGKALLKQVKITVFRNRQSIDINLVLFVPKTATTPPPVFLFINNREKEIIDPTRQHKSDFWPAELVIDSGYAIAAFQNSDVAPDNKDSFANGALRLYPEQLKANNGMRAIGAWAWGASRVMDYFQQENDIDKNKVIIIGHSRGGKAALWTSAQDQRFAMCVSNCSGNTGAALSRRKFGETVAIINTVFPHWFTTNYKKFNNNEDALPVDQHMLLALSAPRPLYTTNASNDEWADPKGSWLSLKNAEPVYALYGIRAALPQDAPPLNHPLISSPLGYHIREGIHDLTAYDWKNFIRFAKLHL